MKHSMLQTEKQLKYLHCLFNNLDKYEYLTGEDLGHRPSTVEQARFEYSPLSKFLNMGLKEEVKKEGRLKILKNIVGKNEQQLKTIEYQRNKKFNAIKNINIGSKEPKVINYFNKISPEAEKLMNELREGQDFIDFEKLSFVGANKKYFHFRVFKDPIKFTSIIYHKGSLNSAKDTQNKMFAKLDGFEECNPRKPGTVEEKKEVLINAYKFYNTRNELIKAFEDGVFPLKDGFQEKELDVLELPDWVRVNEKIFNLNKRRG